VVRHLWMGALGLLVVVAAARAEDAAAPAADEAVPTAGVQATPAPAPAPAAATAPQTADEKASLQVRSLEERVSSLKEKIFRTKARLLNLQEMVIGGDISTGAKAVLVHRNEMGSSFYLESVAYALDGAPIFTKVDNQGDLDKREEFEIFNGRIVPGNHQIAVRMVYRGHGYGIFSYLEGYKFKLQSNQTFSAEAGKVTTMKVVGFEKGGITTDIKDKPAIRYDIVFAKDQAPARPGAAGDAPSDAK